MKKKLLFLCTILFSTVIFAQKARMVEMQKRDVMQYVANVNVISPSVPSTNAAAPAPLWSDDFSDPNNWVIDHDPTACALDWQIGINSCTGSYQTADILSTTAANGWALIDSDAYGGALGGTEVEDCWLTMANPVDLNGYPYVDLQFETNYRSYNSEQCYIVVGIGDGSGNVTWPDLTPTTDISNMPNVFKLFPGFGTGDGTTNPQLITVNLGSALVGLTATQLADIYIRFHWTGTWGYAWFVDDVSLSITPDNALAFNSPSFGGWWIGYNSTIGIGADYTFYPMNQATAQPYRIEGVLSNMGILDQSNATMNVNVEDPAGTITSLSSVPALMSNSQYDTVATTSTFSPSNNGIHQLSFWGSSDSVSSTDTIALSFRVTDTVYGADYDWQSDGANASGYAYLARPDCGQVLGNVFDMFTADELTSISFHVSDESVAGAKVKVQVYEDNSTETAINVLWEAESDDYELKPEDIGAWVTLPVSVSLAAGKSYVAAVKGTQHPNDTVGISVSGNNHATSGYIQDNGCNISSSGNGSPGDWYNSSSKLIRMNFGPAPWEIYVEPNGLNDIVPQFNLYPNPTNGLFTIELEENSRYDITIHNILGQIVYTTSTNDMKTIVDLSAFDKGIYTIELKDDNNMIYTEKVFLQ